MPHLRIISATWLTTPKLCLRDELRALVTRMSYAPKFRARDYELELCWNNDAGYASWHFTNYGNASLRPEYDSQLLKTSRLADTIKDEDQDLKQYLILYQVLLYSYLPSIILPLRLPSYYWLGVNRLSTITNDQNT